MHKAPHIPLLLLKQNINYYYSTLTHILSLPITGSIPTPSLSLPLSLSPISIFFYALGFKILLHLILYTVILIPKRDNLLIHA